MLYSIKHKDHVINPLFLRNLPVEEEVEDETDEFYCPLLPVYYCAERRFVAEFKCVLPQVGKYKPIKFELFRFGS